MNAVLNFLVKDAKTNRIFMLHHEMVAENIFEVYESCWEAIKPFRWTRPQAWSLALDDQETPLVCWMLRFEEYKVSSGWDADDGLGIEDKTILVFKPFKAFTLEEVNALEAEREEDGWLIGRTKKSTMETGGVLVDFRYPFDHQTFDLTELL